MIPPDKQAPPDSWAVFDSLTRTDPDLPTTISSIPSTPPQKRRMLLRTGIIVVAVLGLLALIYGIDLATSSGDVPRGVTVAGVPVGGMARAEAEQLLREQLEPRMSHPIAMQAGEVNVTLDPARSGLTLDWPATLDQAGQQPLNPWTRLSSLWRTREVGVISSENRAALTMRCRSCAAKPTGTRSRGRSASRAPDR